jgi:hypothetical protein
LFDFGFGQISLDRNARAPVRRACTLFSFLFYFVGLHAHFYNNAVTLSRLCFASERNERKRRSLIITMLATRNSQVFRAASRPQQRRLLMSSTARRAVLLLNAAASSSPSNGNGSGRCVAAAPPPQPMRVLEDVAAFQAAVADGRHGRVVEFDGVFVGGVFLGVARRGGARTRASTNTLRLDFCERVCATQPGDMPPLVADNISNKNATYSNEQRHGAAR